MNIFIKNLVLIILITVAFSCEKHLPVFTMDQISLIPYPNSVSPSVEVLNVNKIKLIQFDESNSTLVEMGLDLQSFWTAHTQLEVGLKNKSETNSWSHESSRIVCFCYFCKKGDKQNACDNAFWTKCSKMLYTKKAPAVIGRATKHKVRLCHEQNRIGTQKVFDQEKKKLV